MTDELFKIRVKVRDALIENVESEKKVRALENQIRDLGE
jgi:hypothetical protein